MRNNKPPVFTSLNKFGQANQTSPDDYVWVGGIWAGNISGCMLAPNWM